MGVPYDEYIRTLQQNRVNKSYEFVRSSVKHLHFSIQGNQLSVQDGVNGVSCLDYDCIYLRFCRNRPQQTKSLALFAAKNGIPLIGRHVLHTESSSKLAEYSELAGQGLPLIDSFSATGGQIRKVFRNNPPLEYPVIAKSITGTLGSNNHLINSFVELEKLLQVYPDTTFILQRFIPNDGDYRILIMDGQPAVVLYRSRTHGHLNNTSQGSSALVLTLEEVPSELLETSRRAARILDRDDLCGVDIVVDKTDNAHYVLEVNRNPQIETGAAINQKSTALNQFVARLMGV